MSLILYIYPSSFYNSNDLVYPDGNVVEAK